MVDQRSIIRLPTANEMRAILADPECRQHISAWHSMRRSVQVLQ